MIQISGKQKFYLNGPFYTGFFIDSASLIEQGYSLLQKKILEKLQEKKAVGWAVEGLRDRDDLLFAVEFSQKSVYAGTPKIGHSFLLHKTPISALEIKFHDHRFIVNWVVNYYHDYGVGVYSIDVDVFLSRELDLKEYRTLIEQFSGIMPQKINPYIQDDTIELMQVLIENNISIDNYEDICEVLAQKSANFMPLRKSLWFHRVFIFNIDQEISKELVNEYLGLLSSSQPDGPQNCSLSPYAAVFPGYGNSLLIFNDKLDIKINIDRLIETAQFYYAASSLLDTILFEKFAQFSSKREGNPRIREIEKEVNEVQHLSEQLELFLLILKDSIINFSPDSTQMWKTLEREWYYIPILEALREKNILLNEKYTELLNELNRQRQAALNKLVKVFTIFAIAGPLLEAYSFIDTYNMEITNFINVLIANLPLLLIIIIPIMFVAVPLIIIIGKKTIFKYF